MKQNYIAHWGVLGMKWGVRRESRPTSSDHTAYKELRKHPARKLSNKELQAAILRASLEKQYKDISNKPAGKGEKAVKSFLGTYGKTASSAVAAGLGAATGAFLLKEILMNNGRVKRTAKAASRAVIRGILG